MLLLSLASIDSLKLNPKKAFQYILHFLGRLSAQPQQWVLQQFGMEKLQKDGYEYLLSIPYDTKEELERIIYNEIYAEMESIAD